MIVQGVRGMVHRVIRSRRRVWSVPPVLQNQKPRSHSYQESIGDDSTQSAFGTERPAGEPVGSCCDRVPELMLEADKKSAYRDSRKDEAEIPSEVSPAGEPEVAGELSQECEKHACEKDVDERDDGERGIEEMEETENQG